MEPSLQLKLVHNNCPIQNISQYFEATVTMLSVEIILPFMVQEIMVVPEATGWLTINYLSFIHGVIADVDDRPWVCLGGSVCDSGSEEKEGKEMRDCV